MKIKKIIGCTIAILAIGTIGVGVWHGVKYKDKPNDLGGVEQPKPDNPEKPDTPDAPLVHKVIFQIGDITEEQNIAHGSYANIVFPTTIEGKRFIGWYIGEEKIDVANYSIMEDTIFTAKFEDIVYVVTIEIDGETKTQTVNHGEYLNFEEPTKEGYTYLGLSLDGVNITDLTTYPITQDLTLIALFEPSVTSASLFTFDGDTITGYDGQESVVVIPTTYSLGELKTTTREFADSLELEDYMSDNDLLELEIIDANNEKSTIYFYQTSELAYPVTAEVKIQTYIDGTDFTVTKLSHTIFEGNTTLTEVVVPEGITTFGNNIFKNCSNLVSVSLPESLLDLGGSTFSGCSNLTKVNIPNGITLLNTGVFYNCISLKNIIIPNSVTSLNGNVFYGCTRLENIAIPNSVTTIQSSSFENCTSLKSIVIPEGVEMLQSRTFLGCTNLQEVSLPSTLTTINGSVFKNCSVLDNVVIPNKVATIGGDAFLGCSKLSNLVIGSGVTSFASHVFKDCSSLSNVNYLGSVNSWASITFGDLYSNPFKTLDFKVNGQVVTEVFIDNVSKVGNYSFYTFRNITKLTIGENVTEIGNFAFSDCSNIADISILNGLKNIGTSAFYGCSGIKDIVIPDSVVSISDKAFRSCSELLSITIGSGVTSIGNLVFEYDNKLATIKIKSETIPTITASIIPNTTCKVYVQDELLETYKTSEYWSTNASQFYALSE